MKMAIILFLPRTDTNQHEQEENVGVKVRVVCLVRGKKSEICAGYEKNSRTSFNKRKFVVYIKIV